MKVFAFAQPDCAMHSFETQLNVKKDISPLVHPLKYGVIIMRLTACLIALCAITSPAVAAPQSTEEPVSLRVPYADLDLTLEADRSALEARVSASLRKACRASAGSRYTLGRKPVDEKCVADGIAATKVEVERLAAAEMRRGREVAAN
jgi:UrcA family protein